jgi:exonuclease VII large subunit
MAKRDRMVHTFTDPLRLFLSMVLLCPFIAFSFIFLGTTGILIVYIMCLALYQEVCNKSREDELQLLKRRLETAKLNEKQLLSRMREGLCGADEHHRHLENQLVERNEELHSAKQDYKNVKEHCYNLTKQLEQMSKELHHKNVKKHCDNLTKQLEQKSKELHGVKQNYENLVTRFVEQGQDMHRAQKSSEEAHKKLVEQRQLLINVLKFNSATIICPVTMEPITSPTVLECGHVFETESARGWLNAKGRGARCPSCRAPFRVVK